MKAFIFARSIVVVAGVLFLMACQNAKMEKTNPPPQPVPVAQQYPPGGPGPGPGMPPGSQMPPGQMGPGQQQPQQPIVYPPPVDRSVPRPTPITYPDRPIIIRDENRVGPMPPNPPRQTGRPASVRPELNIVDHFEKPGPYEKVVENCGKECPPKPPCTKPDCNVTTVIDNNPPPPVIPIPAPVTASPVRRENDDIEKQCAPIELRKREVVQKLDLLFVVDTSGSMDSERDKVAAGIGQFAHHLGYKDKDLRIAVLPANGMGAQGYAQLVDGVMDLEAIKRGVGEDKALSTLGEELKHRFHNLPQDQTDAQGEVGLVATHDLVTQAGYLHQAKQAGFFRADAALMVVYISDENDVCFNYEKAGLRPNYVYPGQNVGAQGAPGDAIGRDPFEARTFNKAGVCKQVGPRGEDLTPELVHEALKNVKGGQPLIVSGIVYKREGQIPEATGPYKYEKEKGRGYLDLVRLVHSSEDNAYDLSDKDFGKHLANMANVARVRMEYETVVSMQLPAGADPARIDENSIRVVVQNAQGAVLKEFQTRCAKVGANCPSNIGAAQYVREDDGRGHIVPKVSIPPEVAKNLNEGSKAIIYYRNKP